MHLLKQHKKGGKFICYTLIILLQYVVRTTYPVNWDSHNVSSKRDIRWYFTYFSLSIRRLVNHMALLNELVGRRVPERADAAAETLYAVPSAVMEAVTKKGIPWERVMDNVCGWSQAVSSINKYYFVVFLKHVSNSS